MASITLAELHIFHAIDREVFSRLVITLKRQPAQSLLIMALVLWLEDAKNCDLVSKLAKVSDNLLDAVANEVGLCLNILKTKIPTTHGGSLHLMTRFMGTEITLKTISKLKYTAISGVKAFLKNICAWIFTDILLQVIPTPSDININISPLSIPGFPHPVFGSLEIFLLPLNFTLPVEGLWGWKLNFEAPIVDRTLFLTFSRGFPVSEDEAKAFFMKMCGDCIEHFEMEVVVKPKTQALYAQMVLRSVAYMDQIMTGKHIAKFRSNGKHIWARKFEKHIIYNTTPQCAASYALAEPTSARVRLNRSSAAEGSRRSKEMSNKIKEV
ncbi:hypothetical protein Cgig2_009725 [Carnegiea gigantea]|uniref:Uncharacterized protein n=1 Tax=Carnegiea gigantea TaxID=171969 RepID=A0A9Q1K3U2_9CARY|nr:hypothetical protein Cgig2_009725 [Carnegiea gigantea]